MVSVSFTREALTSFRKLPMHIRLEYNETINKMETTSRLRLPGPYATHPLKNTKTLWTLVVDGYRGVYQWTGSEITFVRFGERRTAYYNLPRHYLRV